MVDIRLCAFSDEAATGLDGQIEAMLDNGIKYLEVRGVDGKNISDLSGGEVKQLNEKLDSHGLAVWSIGSPIGKINISDDFKAHLEKFKHTMEIACSTGARVMRIFSFYVEDGTASQYRDIVMERLSRFIELSEGSGVLLCHENEKGIYGDTPEHCLDICSSVKGIRAVFDPANFIQCNSDPLKAWELLEKHVEYLHIKDADNTGANVPAGTGSGHIPEIIKRYYDKGGRVLSLEPHLWSFEGLSALEKDGKAHVANAANTQRRAFDLGVESLKKILAEEIRNE